MNLLCANTLHKYGLPAKLAKNECWPSTRCEFVGVLIDTVWGAVAVSAARCDKLRVRANDLMTEVCIYALPLDGSAGFEVITSDASRWAEEVMWHNFRLHYAFTSKRLERWGTSANIRELFFMVPWSIQHIGAQLTGGNILYRLDNTAYVDADNNKGASPHPDSLALLLWLLSLMQRYDIKLIARHIPGRQENNLTDCLSRLRGAVDDQDCRLLVAIFRDSRAHRRPLTTSSLDQWECSGVFIDTAVTQWQDICYTRHLVCAPPCEVTDTLPHDLFRKMSH
eukprot:jgi/Tetstr1/447623/TSEL_034984.t1